MERAIVNSGVELEYERVGEGEPVIFIHGALIADAFQPLLRQPSLTTGSRMLNYHRRGHAGSSPGTGPVNVEQHARDCLSLMDALGIDRAHVDGHSYGGDIALQMALDAPQMVHSLALLEPALFVGSSAAGYRAALEGARTRYREAGGEVTLNEFLAARWPTYRAPLDAAIPGGFDQGARDAGVFFERELPGLLAWTFGEVEAQRINAPVLSILGGNDDIPGSRFAETHHFILSTMPRPERAVVSDGWHLFHVQDPAATAAVLADFWAGHPIPDQ